jgi:dihydrofolate reductase
MARSVLYMWMSLDGYIAGPDDDVGQALGRGGNRLHASLGYDGTEETVGVRPPGPSGEVFDELMATKAVLVGRRTFDHAGGYEGDHHDGVPIFVPTRGEPPAPASELVTYVTDGIESAMRQAKAAAGDGDVLVHGADFTQELLRAGLLDEIELGLAHVLLGGGRRLFGELAVQVELELTRLLEGPDVTYMRFRVNR